MDVTGLTDQQIQKKVLEAYKIFQEIEKELEMHVSPEDAKEMAKNLVKSELAKTITINTTPQENLTDNLPEKVI